MTWMSYRFVKELYVDQVTTQLKTLSKIVSQQFDRTYLDILNLGTPTKTTQEYFGTIFKKYLTANPNSELFIFNSDLKVLLHLNQDALLGESNPQLLLNRNEILNLDQDHSTVSLPFKGNDGKWYLWGFFRLNNEHWLAIREDANKLEKIDDLSKLFLIVGIIGAVVTLVIGWLVAKSITRPIDRLVRFSSEIGQGNLNTSPPVKMHGEIERLSVEMDRMRQNLFRNQKEKEDILAQIAHEIRNPLGGIELFSSLIKEDLQRDNRSTEYIDKILGEVNDLKNLITAYLNFSRPQTAEQDIVNLPLLFSELKNFVKNRLENKNITIVENLEVDEILFDQSHLKMILLNLLSNSVDSVPQNGVIKFESFISKSETKISISDNGNGISEKDLPNIFKPFFTTKKEGTGLGLAISQKLCIENNAELVVHNNIDSGSTFSIIKKNKPYDR